MSAMRTTAAIKPSKAAARHPPTAGCCEELFGSSSDSESGSGSGGADAAAGEAASEQEEAPSSPARFASPTSPAYVPRSPSPPRVRRGWGGWSRHVRGAEVESISDSDDSTYDPSERAAASSSRNRGPVRRPYVRNRFQEQRGQSSEPGCCKATADLLRSTQKRLRELEAVHTATTDAYLDCVSRLGSAKRKLAKVADLLHQ